MTKQIEWEFVEHDDGGECVLCGYTDEGWLYSPRWSFARLPGGVLVCEICIDDPYRSEDVPIDERRAPIDERLEERGANLQRKAAATRALIGKKLTLPSAAEFRAACRVASADKIAEERAADEWADAQLAEAEGNAPLEA